jgi:putative hemolysin
VTFWEQVEIAALVFVLAVLMLLSASENTLVCADPLNIENLTSQKDPRAVRALALLRERRRLLLALLLLRSAMAVAAAALGMLVAVHGWGAKVSVAVAGAAVSVAGILLCEVASKAYAASRAGALLFRLGGLLGLVLKVVGPVASLLQRVADSAGRPKIPGDYSPEEVRATLRRWAAGGLLPEEESRPITGGLRLSEIPVRAIMTPLADLQALPAETPAPQALEIFIREGYSRLPVYRGRIDDIVGVLHLRDTLRALHSHPEGEPVREAWELMRSPLFVPSTQLAGDVLRQLQVRRTALAVVTDEFGGAVGICTVEDIVEELVGEIRDEHDLEPELVAQDPSGDLYASGRASVRELADYWHVDLPEGPYRTLQGLFFSALCRMPVVGDRIDLEGVILEVLAVDARTLQRVRIRRGPGH